MPLPSGITSIVQSNFTAGRCHLLNREYIVPADLNTLLDSINPRSRCAHCRKPLFSQKFPTELPADFGADKNCLGELIAWCECRRCGKISSIGFRRKR